MKLIKNNEEMDKIFNNDSIESYLVFCPEYGIPKVVHESLDDAIIESQRLAKNKPNQRFYVLKVVGFSIGEVNTKWNTKTISSSEELKFERQLAKLEEAKQLLKGILL